MAVDNTHFKGCWRPEEDEALRKAVAMHGEKNWSVVARHFNTLMGRSPLLGRAPKQCRSRYLQQLVPGIKTGEWTSEEEEVLVEGHKQFGNQWTLIASMLPGRTETSVKNHYNCTARRKVPSDLNRMTILQRYLASIGVISISSSGKAGKAVPSLGSGYPSSSSSQFFHSHVAYAARPGSRSGHTAGGSPSASQQYDEYTEGSALMQQVPLYQPAVDMDEGDNQHMEQYDHYQQYEQQYQHCEQQYEQQVYDGDCNVEDNAEGAAAGLLQLARAALMHLNQDEPEDGAASYQNKHESGEVADNECDQQHEEVGSGEQQDPQQQTGRQPGSGLCIRSEPVVRSNSEDSAHTAEDEEGSPMAEANLKLQLQQRKPCGNIMGKRLPAAGEQLMLGALGTKRHRPMWEQGPCGPVPPTLSRLARPVLDVSEPHFAAPGTIAADASSPASPPMAASARGVSHAGVAGQQSDAQSQLLAIMMQAFMGAAATEGTTSATALSPNHLAAVARIMALSGLALGGQGYNTGTAAPAAGQPLGGQTASAVSDVLAALAQQGAASMPGAATPASAWSASSVEQQIRTNAGQ